MNRQKTKTLLSAAVTLLIWLIIPHARADITLTTLVSFAGANGSSFDGTNGDWVQALIQVQDGSWKRHLKLTADDPDDTDAEGCRTSFDIFAFTQRVNTRFEGIFFLSALSAESVVSAAFFTVLRCRVAIGLLI